MGLPSSGSPTSGYRVIFLGVYHNIYYKSINSYNIGYLNSAMSFSERFGRFIGEFLYGVDRTLLVFLWGKSSHKNLVSVMI